MMKDAKKSPSPGQAASPSLDEMYSRHAMYTLATSEPNMSPMDHYVAFSLAIRNRVADRWVKTQDSYSRDNVRQVYYLSMEFLIGRVLAAYIQNLQMWDECKNLLENRDLRWEDIYRQEDDPGLGNGGLGRLAACFMDSMATMGLPCTGYGLHYDYGIFRQKIVNGCQVEEPDYWRRNSYPWEIKRADSDVQVMFGGHTEIIDEGGRKVWRWIPASSVRGVPYDIPVLGYGGKTVNTLRLWSAVSDNELDFSNFNRGSYMEAVQSKVYAETLTKVLYPNDNMAEGKELRLRQQYFFVACTLRDILRKHRRRAPQAGWDELFSKIFIQLNDTHPALVIPELMRILVDEENVDWDIAWRLTTSCVGYTNHTILPEALETWGLDLFHKVLPRHLEIIFEINRRFLDVVGALYPGDEDRLRRMSIIEETGGRKVRMANLALVGASKVNGVARIHSRILKEEIFRDFADIWPDKFTNMTNGITQRRWLLKTNPGLAALISRRIGDGWITNLEELRRLEDNMDDALLDEFGMVKRHCKEALADYIHETLHVTVNPDSIFDVQVKRMHEYKRQLLLVLYIIMLYNRLVRNPELDVHPRTFIVSGKAAPGYDMAKLVIRLIHRVAEHIDNNAQIRDRIKLVFLPDYRVSLAERIVPAANVSEQISLAGTEASGTGNMKLMLNGALTLGTMDGANVEILEEVGKDNIFIFGMRADEVRRRRKTYDPMEEYMGNPDIHQVIEAIRSNVFSRMEPGVFQPLVDNLLRSDYYMLLADLQDYADTQAKVERLYADSRQWNRKALLNVCRAGRFSSDRTIGEYAKEIWHLPPYEVD